MDYNDINSNQQNQFQPPRQPRSTASSGMATASLILGILSLVTLCFIPLSVVFGALSITFALLSKGGEYTLPGNSKAGIIISIAGVLLSIVFTVLVVIAAFSMYGTTEFQNMMDEYQYYYNDYYKDYDYIEDFDNFF